jgi:hypothetical protein
MAARKSRITRKVLDELKTKAQELLPPDQDKPA